ncbi:hypothetical protein BH09SUM1_BH09SUM1_19880 [soil metagenome]
MKRNIHFAGIAALSTVFAANANAAWIINEAETETAGANIQFVELYNPVANSSVAGLTVLDIRSSQARAISSIDLTGSATGNYYLLGNTLYASSAAGISKPAPDATFTLDFRGQYHQILLVNTADLPGGFVAGAAGYVFTGTEFSNGTQIIDSIQMTDGLTDPEYFAAQNEKAIRDHDNVTGLPIAADSPYAFGRFPDGSAFLQGDYPLSAASTISTASTPRATNTFRDERTAVQDWTVFK